ncbi:hypothetical protein [Bradyrhizobium diversitatis]|uniref:hypothetical protein n=1 Tax=Bradyrhizobium diversitatis TaxID=2755406 RepID=UPI001AED1272|nr:hypothetical protein [Bradyrhizobium diversitatis]
MDVFVAVDWLVATIWSRVSCRAVADAAAAGVALAGASEFVLDRLLRRVALCCRCDVTLRADRCACGASTVTGGSAVFCANVGPSGARKAVEPSSSAAPRRTRCDPPVIPIVKTPPQIRRAGLKQNGTIVSSYEVGFFEYLELLKVQKRFRIAQGKA